MTTGVNESGLLAFDEDAVWSGTRNIYQPGLGKTAAFTLQWFFFNFDGSGNDSIRIEVNTIPIIHFQPSVGNAHECLTGILPDQTGSDAAVYAGDIGPSAGTHILAPLRFKYYMKDNEYLRVIASGGVAHQIWVFGVEYNN